MEVGESEDRSRPGEDIERDDRIYPVTRLVAVGIIPFLLVAFWVLYFDPDNTAKRFAWTIMPRMEPLLMGAGYLAGAYFFARVALATQWHRGALGFPAVTTFATFMGIATILHWDRFNHTHLAFILWVILYFTTPFVVFTIWLFNRRTDPRTAQKDDVQIPAVVRWSGGLLGAVLVINGLLLLLDPGLMIPTWPWTLTPLTARVTGGWFALPGVLQLGIALDGRWSAARMPLQSQALGIVLILVGIGRAWADFDATNPVTWFIVTGLAGLLVAIAVLYTVMERRRHIQLSLPQAA